MISISEGIAALKNNQSDLYKFKIIYPKKGFVQPDPVS